MTSRYYDNDVTLLLWWRHVIVMMTSCCYDNNVTLLWWRRHVIVMMTSRYCYDDVTLPSWLRHVIVMVTSYWRNDDILDDHRKRKCPFLPYNLSNNTIFISLGTYSWSNRCTRVYPRCSPFRTMRPLSPHLLTRTLLFTLLKRRSLTRTTNWLLDTIRFYFRL